MFVLYRVFVLICVFVLISVSVSVFVLFVFLFGGVYSLYGCVFVFVYYL